ncbi:hypothetical protein ACTHPZ_06280 [Bacillus halotolerans]|uniref:hypothetical protein n=1 Tax=Bacillus halotolerans TaxID=260554 RepID=UPI003F7C75BE
MLTDEKVDQIDDLLHQLKNASSRMLWNQDQLNSKAFTHYAFTKFKGIVIKENYIGGLRVFGGTFMGKTVAMKHWVPV